jgi:PucR C-terminal helix-turn-helix domain/GGDEF-like domain
MAHSPSRTTARASRPASSRAPAVDGLSDLITAAVDAFTADLDALVDEMASAAITTAPALAQHAALEDSVRASVRAMTLRWVDAERHRPGEPVPVDVPPAAIDVARDLVRHGVDISHLLTGYRAAQNVGCRRWLHAAAQASPPEMVIAVADFGLTSIYAWVDGALDLITSQIARERDELVGGMLSRRLETATLIIEGAPISEEVARSRLGYALSGWHTAVVLSSSSADHEQGLLEATGRSLALRAGLRPPLILSASATTTWVWLGSDRPLEPDMLRGAMDEAAPGVHGSAGSSRTKMTGFRLSHREAVATRRIAERSGTGEQFTAYNDVRFAVLASQDDEAAEQFVADTLGQLAGADIVLREALRIFLQEDANTARTAVRLFTHRNTVLNRIERAERLLPRPLAGRRLHVALALELQRWSSRRD